MLENVDLENNGQSDVAEHPQRCHLMEYIIFPLAFIISEILVFQICLR